MELRVTNVADVCRQLASWAGEAELTPEAVLDLLRADVMARPGLPRSSAVGDALRLADGLVKEAGETLPELLDELVREEDLMRSEGARLFPGPVRAVDLGKGRYRVFAGQPTVQLRELLGGTWQAKGPVRHCITEDTDEFVRMVRDQKGLVLDPETWAGLGSTPSADASWIAELNRRLECCALPAGTGADEGAAEWQCWRPRRLPSAWRPESSDEAALWRSRTFFGYWRFAWTTGESPVAARFVKLSPDEASRTVFATAKAVSNPLAAAFAVEGDHALLETGAWLPRAEYRAVSVCSDALCRSGGKSQWTIPIANVKQIASILVDRLGMHVTGGEELE